MSSLRLANNPMQSKLPMHMSPRYHARTRSQTPCQSPEMANGRCRMHEGKAKGAAKGERYPTFVMAHLDSETKG